MKSLNLLNRQISNSRLHSAFLLRAHQRFQSSQTFSSSSLTTTSPSPPPPPEEIFYMRPLPSSCIDWQSSKGRTLFAEALTAGTMECYFALAAQFVTQGEPAYCGPATLAQVLNALNIDPGRVWKGPWRWYVDSMLDSCVSPKVMQTEGISLSSFVCLARCNGAAATFTRPPPEISSVDVLPSIDITSAMEKSLTKFRETISTSSKCSSGPFVVAAYAREALGQTGVGHYSPIGGYHKEEDMVLLLDVARFKYPPHWVSIKDLHKAMMRIDDATGLPRGYVTINKSASVPLVLFSFSGSASLQVGGGDSSSSSSSSSSSLSGANTGNCIGQGQSIDSAKAHVLTAIDLMNKYANTQEEDDTTLTNTFSDINAVQIAVQSLLQKRPDGSTSFQLFQPLVDPSSSSCGSKTCASSSSSSLRNVTIAKCVTRLSKEQVSAAARLLSDIEATPLFGMIRRAILSGPLSSTTKSVISNEEAINMATSTTTLTAECDHGKQTCVRVEASHILTMLLLTFFSHGSTIVTTTTTTTSKGKRRNVSEKLQKLVSQSLLVASPLVSAEVKLLRNQVDIA